MSQEEVKVLKVTSVLVLDWTGSRFLVLSKSLVSLGVFVSGNGVPENR